MFSALGQGETLYAPPIQGASLQERMQNRKKEGLYSRKACNRKSQMMEKKSTLNSADLFQRVKTLKSKREHLQITSLQENIILPLRAGECRLPKCENIRTGMTFAI